MKKTKNKLDDIPGDIVSRVHELIALLESGKFNKIKDLGDLGDLLPVLRDSVEHRCHGISKRLEVAIMLAGAFEVKGRFNKRSEFWAMLLSEAQELIDMDLKFVNK